MKACAEDTREFLNLVKEDFIFATACAECGQCLADAMLRDDLPMNSWLYKTLFVTQLRELAMALARILEDGTRSASVAKYLRHIEQNAENCAAVSLRDAGAAISTKECRIRVAALKRAIADIRDRYPRVKAIRDGMLSHTDKRYRLANAQIRFGEDELADLRACLNELSRVLHEIDELVADNRLALDLVSDGVKKDFDALLQDRAERNRGLKALKEHHLSCTERKQGGNE